MKLPWLLLALALAAPAFALPDNSPVPGGVAVIDLGPVSREAPTARWREQALAVVKDSGRWFALFGIPLDTVPGETEISVFSGSTATVRNVAVRGKAYPEQRLTIRDKRKVDPDPDDLARIAREREVTDAIKRRFSDGMPDTAFALPAHGPLSSRFGLRRIFNGQPRNPHAGLDVAVGTGAPVKAPAAGVLAKTRPSFLRRNWGCVGQRVGVYPPLSKKRGGIPALPTPPPK